MPGYIKRWRRIRRLRLPRASLYNEVVLAEASPGPNRSPLIVQVGRSVLGSSGHGILHPLQVAPPLTLRGGTLGYRRRRIGQLRNAPSGWRSKRCVRSLCLERPGPDLVAAGAGHQPGQPGPLGPTAPGRRSRASRPLDKPFLHRDREHFLHVRRRWSSLATRAHWQLRLWLRCGCNRFRGRAARVGLVGRRLARQRLDRHRRRAPLGPRRSWFGRKHSPPRLGDAFQAQRRAAYMS